MEASLKLAMVLIDPSRKEVCWPTLFQAVKNVVKAGVITDETRTSLKTWLKSNDQLLQMLSLTVIHTISLNCGPNVRQSLAGPKWMKRLEQQFGRPQSPAVGAALGQLFQDWAYLFSHEELGQRCRAILTQSRFKQHADLPPSQAAIDVADDERLCMPPVAPAKGVDFIKRFLGTGESSPSLGGMSHSMPSADSDPFSSSAPHQNKATAGSSGGGGYQDPSANPFDRGPSSVLVNPSYRPHAAEQGGRGSSSGHGPPNNLSSISYGGVNIYVGASGVNGSGGSNGMPHSSSAPRLHEGAFGSSAGGGGASGVTSSGSIPSLSVLLRDDVPLICGAAAVPAEVPLLAPRMAADAALLRRLAESCRLAASSSSGGSISSNSSFSGGSSHHVWMLLNDGFVAAERCSSWRKKVQGWAQQWDDPVAVAQLLAATDSINAALEQWQRISTSDVFSLMRIHVSDNPPRQASSGSSSLNSSLRQPDPATPVSAMTAASQNQSSNAAARPAPDLADLLGDMVPLPTGSSAWGSPRHSASAGVGTSSLTPHSNLGNGMLHTVGHHGDSLSAGSLFGSGAVTGAAAWLPPPSASSNPFASLSVSSSSPNISSHHHNLQNNGVAAKPHRPPSMLCNPFDSLLSDRDLPRSSGGGGGPAGSPSQPMRGNSNPFTVQSPTGTASATAAGGSMPAASAAAAGSVANPFAVVAAGRTDAAAGSNSTSYPPLPTSFLASPRTNPFAAASAPIWGGPPNTSGTFSPITNTSPFQGGVMRPASPPSASAPPVQLSQHYGSAPLVGPVPSATPPLPSPTHSSPQIHLPPTLPSPSTRHASSPPAPAAPSTTSPLTNSPPASKVGVALSAPVASSSPRPNATAASTTSANGSSANGGNMSPQPSPSQPSRAEWRAELDRRGAPLAQLAASAGDATVAAAWQSVRQLFVTMQLRHEAALMEVRDNAARAAAALAEAHAAEMREVKAQALAKFRELSGSASAGGSGASSASAVVPSRRAAGESPGTLASVTAVTANGVQAGSLDGSARSLTSANLPATPVDSPLEVSFVSSLFASGTGAHKATGQAQHKFVSQRTSGGEVAHVQSSSVGNGLSHMAGYSNRQHPAAGQVPSHAFGSNGGGDPRLDLL